MLINKLKTCKAIDMESKLKEYVIKNYDNESLTEKVKTYFGEVTQGRNVMSQMGEYHDDISQLKQNINIITTYLNMLFAIKQKMTFGKESYSCKIEFIWTDTIKKSKWDSYNIYFEIYNAMFNLATSYYNLGAQIAKSATEKNGHKEASKNFKHAMYLFDVIKQEALSKIPEKELPYDLYPSHLDYCITLCEIQGQLEIYAIAKETNPTQFELHSKLLCCVAELYDKARNLADNPQTKKGTKDDLLNFLSNRAFYYKALMCKDMRDKAKKDFDNSGEGYGKILVLQGLFVANLLECQKNIKKCGNLVDQEGFEKMLNEEKTEGQNMHDLNQRIYHQREPDISEITFDKKNMMTMAIPDDLYIRENAEKIKKDEKIYCQDLELLVPKQVKDMINNYKEKMNRIMNGIMRKSSYLINELENLLKSLEAEDKDDQMCRQRFRDKWIRKTSQELNFKLVQGAKNYLQSLNNTKKYDIQENNNIMNEARFYEQLLLPREQLLNKIPRREELQEKEIPEETEIHEAILKLYELGDKCMQIINPIFAELNDDSNIVGQFVEVLAKKTTEQAIYEKFKEIYEQKFNELKPLSDEVKKQEQVVNEIVQKNSQKIRDKPKQNISNEAMEYFRNLDQYANMFMKKYEKVKKGDTYYNDLYQKVSQLLKSGNDWMIKRSDEKNAILSTIKGASGLSDFSATRLNSGELLNPETNPFTKMNVNINRGGNYGMAYNQGNNNYNQNNNYNNNQRGNQGGYPPQQGFGGH